MRRRREDMGNENKKQRTEEERAAMRFGVLPVGNFTVDSTKTKVVVAKGSVVDFSGDCCVNAANTGCLFGGGVDGAICRAGGDDLDKARRALPVLRRGVRCETGDAKITIGGDLNAKYCVHAVGPQYYLERRGFSDEELDTILYSAYVESLKRAQEKEVKTMGFCLLSAGVFRAHRPLSVVLQIGLMALLENTYEGLEEVYLVGFTPKEVGTLRKLMEMYVENQAYPHELKILKNETEKIKQRIIEDDKKSGWASSSDEEEDMKNMKFSKGDKAKLVNTAKFAGTVGEIIGFNTAKKKYRVQGVFDGAKKVFLLPENCLEPVPATPAAEEEVEAMEVDEPEAKPEAAAETVKEDAAVSKEAAEAQDSAAAPAAADPPQADEAEPQKEVAKSEVVSKPHDDSNKEETTS